MGLEYYNENKKEEDECIIEMYWDWYNKHYDGPLTDSVASILYKSTRYTNKYIWRIMHFEESKGKFLAGEVRITNGQMMDISSVLCRESFKVLKLNLAGSHGPVSDQHVHVEMCNEHCLLNDSLRQIAMSYSGCNCVQLPSLSPQGYYLPLNKDWCEQNSARILCDELEICGRWICAMDDFHCPRRDYNSKEIPIKGRGDQCNDAMFIATNMIPLLMFTTICFWILL